MSSYKPTPEEEYMPAGCDHQHKNGFTSWHVISGESGSGPDFYYDVHTSVCSLCGDIRRAGFRSGKDGKLNHFDEIFDIHTPDAVAAIAKYCNWINSDYEGYDPFVRKSEVLINQPAGKIPGWLPGNIYPDADFIKKPIRITTGNGYYYALGTFDPHDCQWWEVPNNACVPEDRVFYLGEIEKCAATAPHWVKMSERLPTDTRKAARHILLNDTFDYSTIEVLGDTVLIGSKYFYTRKSILEDGDLESWEWLEESSRPSDSANPVPASPTDLLWATRYAALKEQTDVYRNALEEINDRDDGRVNRAMFRVSTEMKEIAAKALALYPSLKTDKDNGTGS